MESSEKEYKNWEVLIRKAIVAEEKTRDQPALQIKEVDQYCPQGYRPILQANKYQQKKRQKQGHIKHRRQQELKSSSSAPQIDQRNEINRSEGKKFHHDKNLHHRQDQRK